MGNEVSTVGGAVATVTTAIAAGITAGQVEALNKAVVQSANFSAEKAQNTIVWHVGETVVHAAALAYHVSSAAITNNSEEIKNRDEAMERTMRSGLSTVNGVVETVNSYGDMIPIVGHAKGGILHIMGEHERGNQSLKAASTSTGVIGGSIAGMVVGGLVGAIVGGLSAYAAMDGLITDIESAVNRESNPQHLDHGLEQHDRRRE
jgi:hypothetical protein